jgi:hypothetical protein
MKQDPKSASLGIVVTTQRDGLKLFSPVIAPNVLVEVQVAALSG